MIVTFDRPDVSLVVEVADGSCYGYYLDQGKIVGDVWLFNTGDTPTSEPWKGEGKPPFQNSVEYCYPHSIKHPILKTDFRVLFNPERVNAAIYFREKLVGIIGPNTRPGKSAFAKMDSPVAKKMDIPVPLPE